MTQVQVSSEGNRYRLKALGHATGSEQVCAAVSGILFSLAGYLKNAEAAGEAQIYGYKLDSGDVLLDASGGSGVEAAFDTALVGLLQLQQSFRGFVSVQSQ